MGVTPGLGDGSYVCTEATDGTRQGRQPAGRWPLPELGWGPGQVTSLFNTLALCPGTGCFTILGRTSTLSLSSTRELLLS
jgi:hypothetical protein